MHELAICQALIQQVRGIVADHQAAAAERVVVAVGPLSGVEPGLLASAYSIARQGSPAEDAPLEIETVPVEVSCSSCGHRGAAEANRLLCEACGNWRVRVTSGEDLLLLRVDLRLQPGPGPATPGTDNEAVRHV